MVSAQIMVEMNHRMVLNIFIISRFNLFNEDASQSDEIYPRGTIPKYFLIQIMTFEVIQSV
jgi:hypothetical protein